MSFLPKDYKISHFYSRLTPIKEAYEGLKITIEKVVAEGEKADSEKCPGFDWENVQLVCEEIYGSAFVIAQSFLRGEFNSLTRHSKILKNDNFNSYLNKFGVKIADFEVNRLNCYIALANCYKHHEEWKTSVSRNGEIEWVISNSNKVTLSVLEKMNVKCSIFPSFDGVGILTSHENEKIFRMIFNDLVHWRNSLVKLDGGSIKIDKW